jgi:L-fuculose-phosphate aldolase
MSAGGQDMTQLMAAAVGVDTLERKGCKMLDIGFGVGGAALDFATTYGASVHGLDVNPVGLEMANATLAARNKERMLDVQNNHLMEPLQIVFEVKSATDATFPAETFDVIYSRDTLLHLDAASKESLFQNCLKWLKPGGTICIGDYCLGRNSEADGKPTASFDTYLQARGYHMWTPSDYGKVLQKAGFETVDSKDMAYWYCTICQTELDRALVPGPSRDTLIKEQGADAVANLEKTYRDKIQMTLRGDRSYALVVAHKQKLKQLSLRQQVCDTYTQLNKTGFVLSCDGNVSARVVNNGDGDDQYILTPTGIDIPDLTAQNMVLCDKNGKPVAGEKFKPTSEVDLHTLIYQTRPDVNAIVHSHSIYACALACCRINLPPTHYAVCELLHAAGNTLPSPDESAVQCSTYHTYGTWDLAMATTLNALGKNHACLMANHGAVIVGATMEEAMYRSDRLERECEIYFKSVQLAKPISLTGEEIQSLHQRDATYGQDS